MRKINLEDTFKFARMIKEANLTNDIKDAYLAGKKEGADEEEVGVTAFMNILCSCSDKKVEVQLYDLLAGITEKTADMVKVQSLDATVSDLKKICEENNITNFLKSASRLSEAIKR